ncbi:transmembrane protein 221 [Onychostruthus taczanowskii]|uniref:transmembrane protein 221 n=1 Tax=Onychostruthus taczanowskii TaxID=356909 RepID=UPI001B801095|nr:transmembrane protein 221 [Onychostruthus taczanowskii]
MPSAYPQRALTVLLLFGTLSAAMALLSSSLIFQLPSGRAAPGGGRGALPEPVAAALLPVSAVLAALCLVLNVSCLLLCLLHGYCSTELCRGQPGPERADWFLLDSRSVRHVAIGLFCCGLCLYLTALALFMLLLFELEAGIASACILTSGILVLLISLLHVLLRASQISQISQGSEPSQALYENDSAQPGDSSDLRNAAPARPRPEIHREFSFPPFLEGKSQPGSASSSNLSSRSKEFHRESQSKEFPREPPSQDWSRTHRTLLDSGLLQEQGKPWNVIARGMRNVMSHRATKDSTLV